MRLKHFYLWFAILSFVMIPLNASAITLTFTVGDMDLVGGRAILNPTPSVNPAAYQMNAGSGGAFDLRSTAERAATNGAELTDRPDGSFGLLLDEALFTHTMDTTDWMTITSASWTLGAGGLSAQDETLHMDGKLIASGSPYFPHLDHNSGGHQVVFCDQITIDINPSNYVDLMDGTVEFLVDFRAAPGVSEPVYLDFATLTVEVELKPPAPPEPDPDPDPIPEPATIALLGIGLAGFAGGAARRKWKKKAVDKS